MTEWYYARGGQQAGPVSFDQLVDLAKSGGLDPVKDLVWNASMKDWTPAGQVNGLFLATTTSVSTPAADPSNPYAAPQSSWVAPVTPETALPEIVPGSEPLDPVACIKRGFDLTARNFGMILLLTIIYLIITFVMNLALAEMDDALGLKPIGMPIDPEAPPMGPIGLAANPSSFQSNGSVLNMLITQVVGIFFLIGTTRIGLNIVSGKPFTVGMLFSGVDKLLPAIAASILFYIAFALCYALLIVPAFFMTISAPFFIVLAVGFVLLSVPAIYIAMRYGQFLNAIVDRNLGVIESFKYSSAITKNNRMNLFLLALLYFLVALAGFLALCIGLFFAIPVISLAGMVAYRWMQYGHRSALDHPGTTTPMLIGN